MKALLALLMLAVCLVLSACQSPSLDQQMEEDLSVLWEPEVIRVSGYSALSSSDSDFQSRLLAMRASRLDAYRTLAEQVYGTLIYSESAVSELGIASDQLRTVVDTAVRGAKVVEVRELQEGGYETVVELVMDARFHHCLTRINTFQSIEECRPPGPTGLDIEQQSLQQPSTGWHIATDKPRGDS